MKQSSHLFLPHSAWAGSLKKTNKNRPVQGFFFENFHFSIVVHNLNMLEVEEENPWAGSLRHVDDHRKGKARKEEKEDTYGNAPWMGTLRYSAYRYIYVYLFGPNKTQ